MAYTIDLSGKVAIITGAAKGIGADTARILAQAGAQVIIDDIVSTKVVRSLQDEIEQIGLRPVYMKEDISDAQSAKRLIQRTVDQFSRVDILVNNAGVVADWDKSYDIHVKGAYYCAEAAKEIMTADGGGKIINITSTCALSGGTGIPEYVATKGALYSLTRYLARTYAPLGILVNGVMPAVIMSDMIMTRYASEEEMIAHYLPLMPIRRIGYPLDIAKIILFLSSDLADFICGEIIIADGGRLNVGC